MQLTDLELRSGKLSADHEDQAIRSLQMLGYIVFENVLSPEKTTHLKDLLLKELADHINGPNPRSTGVGRYNMHLRVDPPFADAEILANPVVLGIMDKLLDGDVVCTYFASDTALKGSEYQLIHADTSELFPSSGTMTCPPHMYVLDIPLVDFREDNGPLEIWPYGTHLAPYFGVGENVGSVEDLSGPTDLAQRFAQSMGPRPTLMPAGSFLIRDARMWHRGTPNQTDDPRPMLALAYHRSWLRGGDMRIRRSVYDSFPEHVRTLLRCSCIEAA